MFSKENISGDVSAGAQIGYGRRRRSLLPAVTGEASTEGRARKRAARTSYRTEGEATQRKGLWMEVGSGSHLDLWYPMKTKRADSTSTFDPVQIVQQILFQKLCSIEHAPTPTIHQYKPLAMAPTRCSHTRFSYWPLLLNL